MISHSENRQVSGRVFNIQRYSLHDGSGIRTLVYGRQYAVEDVGPAPEQEQEQEQEVSRLRGLVARFGLTEISLPA